MSIEAGKIMSFVSYQSSSVLHSEYPHDQRAIDAQYHFDVDFREIVTLEEKKLSL